MRDSSLRVGFVFVLSLTGVACSGGDGGSELPPTMFSEASVAAGRSRALVTWQDPTGDQPQAWGVLVDVHTTPSPVVGTPFVVGLTEQGPAAASDRFGT